MLKAPLLFQLGDLVEEKQSGFRAVGDQPSAYYNMTVGSALFAEGTSRLSREVF